MTTLQPGYPDTLSEVRRISAGGMPRRIAAPKRIIKVSAEQIRWKANAYVRLLISPIQEELE